MSDVIAFDVYGTLVDPLGMRMHLAAVVGPERAGEAAGLWRTTQLEYAFRRAAMGAYVDFDVVTRQALVFACRQLGTELSLALEEDLLARYRELPAYRDVPSGLSALRGERRLVAFSNGTPASVRTVLDRAGILPLLDDVVSVDEVRSFKPDPVVYRHLVARGGTSVERTWLVSSNGWDVIGAKHAGLRAIWLARDPAAVLDPWEIAPDLWVNRLDAIAERL